MCSGMGHRDRLACGMLVHSLATAMPARAAEKTKQLAGGLSMPIPGSMAGTDDGIDSSTALDKAMLQIRVVFKIERNLMQERTKAGLSAARARGRLGSSPPPG